MTTLSFVLTMHTPARVGSAYARDGVDAAVDHHDPIPADHLKGVMRDAASRLLGVTHPLVRAVFGTPARSSPWAWTSAVPEGSWAVDRRHRVSIDADTHAAVKDLLVLGEHAWAASPRFTVERTRPVVVAADPVSFGEEDHVTVLRAAASGVQGLGSWRRRGLGWVGITPASGMVTEDEVRQLLAWRETHR